MEQVDPALEVDVVGGEVLQADLPVDRRARPAHGGDDVGAGPDRRRDVGPDLDHLAEALVAGDEEVVAGRRGPVLGRVDLLVGAVDADAKHLHLHAAAVRDLVDAGLRDLPEMNRVRASWMNGDGFHAATDPHRRRSLQRVSPEGRSGRNSRCGLPLDCVSRRRSSRHEAQRSGGRTPPGSARRARRPAGRSRGAPPHAGRRAGGLGQDDAARGVGGRPSRAAQLRVVHDRPRRQRSGALLGLRDRGAARGRAVGRRIVTAGARRQRHRSRRGRAAAADQRARRARRASSCSCSRTTT